MLGHLDLRTVSVKGQHGQSLKKTRKDGIFNNVMDFFWMLRCSEAEALPNKFSLNTGERAIDTDTDSDTSGEVTIDLSTTIGDESDEERLTRSTALWAAQQQSWEATTCDAVEGRRTLKRYLAWGRATELYWQYCAYAAEVGCRLAAYTSFMRVFKVVFAQKTGFLGFRKKRGSTPRARLAMVTSKS